jgi:ferredoxin
MGRVYIDQDLCTGDGLCEEIAPAVFYGSDDGLYYVRDEGVPRPEYGSAPTNVGAAQPATFSDELAEAVQEASEECPGECIFIERDDGSWTVG